MNYTNRDQSGNYRPSPSLFSLYSLPDEQLQDELLRRSIERSSSPSSFSLFSSTITDKQIQDELLRRSIERRRHSRHTCKFCEGVFTELINKKARIQILNNQLEQQKRQLIEKDRKIEELKKGMIDIGTQNITSSASASLPVAVFPTRSQDREAKKTQMAKIATKRAIKMPMAKKTYYRPLVTNSTLGLPSPPPLYRSQGNSVSITLPRTLKCAQCYKPVFSYVPSLGHQNYRCTRCKLENTALSTNDSEGSEEDCDDRIGSPFFPFDEEEEG